MRPGQLLSDDRITCGFVTGHGSEPDRLEEMGADSPWTGGHIASRNPFPEAMMEHALCVPRTPSDQFMP
jgi:hypothetical protein